MKKYLNIASVAVIAGIVFSVGFVQYEASERLRASLEVDPYCGDGVVHFELEEECDGDTQGMCLENQQCIDCLCVTASLDNSNDNENNEPSTFVIEENASYVPATRIFNTPPHVLVGANVVSMPETIEIDGTELTWLAELFASDDTVIEFSAPLLSEKLADDVDTSFWVYEYQSDEWKTDQFNGQVFLSTAFKESLANDDQAAWEKKVTDNGKLTTFKGGRTYYVWSADPLILDKLTGLQVREICGDGYIVLEEECDDGNNQDGDGCAECMVHPSFECDGEPSVCTALPAS